MKHDPTFDAEVSAILAKPGMDAGQRAEFINSNAWSKMNTKEIAILAMNETHRVIPEAVVEHAVNHQLGLTGDKKKSWQDIFLSDALERTSMLFSIVGSKIAPAPALQIDPSMELKKVDVSSLDVVKWPSDVRDLATMSPKEISALPKMSQEQAMEMDKHNVWKSLDNKQIAVVALTQDRKVMPEQIAENAVNSQLGLKGDKKMSWQDILVGDSMTRASTLIDVLESPKPRTAKNMFEGISAMFGKKPEAEKSHGLRM